MEETILPKRIYVPSRTIVKEGKDRFKLYLPRNFAKLWKLLHGRKVDVLIIVDEGEEDA